MEIIHGNVRILQVWHAHTYILDIWYCNIPYPTVQNGWIYFYCIVNKKWGYQTSMIWDTTGTKTWLHGYFQIESFKPFFLVVETPPSIIQGEVFEVKVLLFNYIETGPEEVQVSLENLEYDICKCCWSPQLISEVDCTLCDILCRPQFPSEERWTIRRRFGVESWRVSRLLLMESAKLWPWV